MRFVVAVLGLSLLAGCGGGEPLPPKEMLNYAGPVYTMNVSEINITHDYMPPKRYPNVDHLADQTPSDTVKEWVHERLKAGGHANSLEVDIKDASILRTDLPKQKTGLEGTFTTEQTEQYDGTLDVEIKIYTPTSPLAIAHIEAVAHRRLTLEEDSDPAERERLYHNMTVDLMNTLMPQLDVNISRYFGNYLM